MFMDFREKEKRGKEKERNIFKSTLLGLTFIRSLKNGILSLFYII